MARFERRENELLRVDLVPGWNAPVVIDLPARLTCTVRARVTVDGVPAAGYVRLVRAPERLAAFRHAGSGAAAIADADGRFACRVPPGRYRLELERDDAAQVWATAPVDLPAGDEERAFAIMTGVLDLVLRDPDGAPARGARVGVAERRTDRVWWFDQADGDGALRLRLPAGSWGVFDRAPGARLDRSDLVQAAADACRELGRVAVRAGETARATIVVPPR